MHTYHMSNLFNKLNFYVYFLFYLCFFNTFIKLYFTFFCPTIVTFSIYMGIVLISNALLPVSKKPRDTQKASKLWQSWRPFMVVRPAPWPHDKFPEWSQDRGSPMHSFTSLLIPAYQGVKQDPSYLWFPPALRPLWLTVWAQLLCPHHRPSVFLRPWFSAVNVEKCTYRALNLLTNLLLIFTPKFGAICAIYATT